MIYLTVGILSFLIGVEAGKRMLSIGYAFAREQARIWERRAWEEFEQRRILEANLTQKNVIDIRSRDVLESRFDQIAKLEKELLETKAQLHELNNERQRVASDKINCEDCNAILARW